MSESLRVQQGGTGEPVLLLLHGLGATGDVWHGLQERLADRWPGRWVTPDLPGHGGSERLPSYSFGQLAASVARSVPANGPVVALGHSLGGVVALVLASGWFGLPIAAVCGLGIKVAWTDAELAQAHALSLKPNRIFPTRTEAADRYLKVAGLAGLIEPDAVPDPALRKEEAGWTMALDPAAFAVGAPDMASLLGAARARVVLAAGELDPMAPAAQLRALVPDPMILSGLGHNAHVESPEALGPVLDRLKAALG